MTRCKCGAVSRTNYSHGKKSKGVPSFTIKHDKDCRFNKENKKNDRR